MKLSLKSSKLSFAKLGMFFYSHGSMIYFVIFTCVLIGAIIGLNIALNKPGDEDYRAQKQSEIQSAKFDTQTIERIKQLNAKQQTQTDELPIGQRINPFGE